MEGALVDATTLAENLEKFVREFEANPGLLSDDMRHRLSDAARNMSISLEAPSDTIQRIVHSPLQLPLACVGLDTRLFETLSQMEESSATNADLADKTKVDPKLMKRLLRYYQSMGMITQRDDDSYSANNVTKAMISTAGKAGVPFYLYAHIPAFNAVPKFLRDNGYANPTDSTRCPWYTGHMTEEAPFDWLQTRPSLFEHMLAWMQSKRDGEPIFLDVIDFERLAHGATSSTILFVDIGGGMGHQCIALKHRYPGLAGRIVVQDQPHVIEQVKATPLPGFDGIEGEAYDFFTPQPLKDARVYYMRNILHDWPDHKCVDILQSVKAGMGKESRLMIDEKVLPECGAPWRSTQVDMGMAAVFGATERSELEWNALLKEAGFSVFRVWKYTERINDCVIEAIPIL